MTNSTLEQAVRNGIDIELAAERFYRLLADSTEEMDAKIFLLKMADQEAEHARRIEDLGKGLDVGDLPRFSESGIESVETCPEWAFVDGIGYPDALQVALQNEEHAAMFYGALADGTKGRIKTFFHQLTLDEEQHIRALKQRLDYLP
jgi:rubrerythrin